MSDFLDRKVCIAPMMGWTDRHYRYFVRQLSRRAVLFSEMLSPEAIILSRKVVCMDFHEAEHPIVFQLGGNNPEMLAEAARQLEGRGVDEINFNVGCPSERGKTQPFGAHLMADPDCVVRCLEAMQSKVSIPVTIKTRIGIDYVDAYEPLAEFVSRVRQSGVSLFYIHARKAWLDGLSTRQNREVPPLRYEYVYQLKKDFPELQIVINGGITEWDQIEGHLQHVDGAMVGRRAYKDPYWVAGTDRFLGEQHTPLDPAGLLRRCLPYVEEELSKGTALREMIRHMVGLARGFRGASDFRQHLAGICARNGADITVYLKAIDLLDEMHQPAVATPA